MMALFGTYYWKNNQYGACKEWYRNKMLYNIGAYQYKRKIKRLNKIDRNNVIEKNNILFLGKILLGKEKEQIKTIISDEIGIF